MLWSINPLKCSLWQRANAQNVTAVLNTCMFITAPINLFDQLS